MPPSPQPLWGLASRARPGDLFCANRGLLAPFADGFLAAVLDGMGTPDKASVATRLAASLLQRHRQEPLLTLVKRCHTSLMPSHGITLALASIHFSTHRLLWLGLGNVQGIVWRATEPPLSRLHARLQPSPALAGYHLPRLQEHSVDLAQGDLLILTSDGIASHFERLLPLEASPQALAPQILAQNFLGTDDATVLVVRYPGSDSIPEPALVEADASSAASPPPAPSPDQPSVPPAPGS